MFTPIAETEVGKSLLTLGTDKRSTMVVFRGPGGFETVIRFDRVVIAPNRLVFYVEPHSHNGRERKTGSMEVSERVASFIREAPNDSELEYTVEEQ